MAQNSFAAHWKIEHMKIVGKQTRVKKKIFEGNQTNLSFFKSNCLFRVSSPSFVHRKQFLEEDQHLAEIYEKYKMRT